MFSLGASFYKTKKGHPGLIGFDRQSTNRGDMNLKGASLTVKEKVLKILVWVRPSSYGIMAETYRVRLRGLNVKIAGLLKKGPKVGAQRRGLIMIMIMIINGIVIVVKICLSLQ